ncbi:hypothetical protein STCU_03273 [Strigomonas culicis]|nr:hypothetical protein STCU_03273 [Strigomonas culicis]|eukprot:EPY31752.1 hypothetical protein STCU_03273 [Strigomonas culicis]
MDVHQFIRDTVMAIWRLGELLLPTGVRPLFPAAQPPSGLYASTLMTFVWVDRDAAGEYVLRGVKDVVRPHFARGALPEEVQGFFAYPAELAEMQVQYLPSQLALQSWLDFVWEYEEGHFCGVEGVIAARLDLSVLPDGVRQFIMPHDVAVAKKCEFLKTQRPVNPMYKKSSDNYGYNVNEEVRKTHLWKAKSLEGKQYGLQYYGLVGKYFAKMRAPMSCTASTGMNLK